MPAISLGTNVCHRSSGGQTLHVGHPFPSQLLVWLLVCTHFQGLSIPNIPTGIFADEMGAASSDLRIKCWTPWISGVFHQTRSDFHPPAVPAYPTSEKKRVLGVGVWMVYLFSGGCLEVDLGSSTSSTATSLSFMFHPTRRTARSENTCLPEAHGGVEALDGAQGSLLRAVGGPQRRGSHAVSTVFSWRKRRKG